MKVILARDVEAAEANAIAIYDKVTEFIENFLHESEKDGETSTADAPARARRAPTKKAAATPKATKTAKRSEESRVGNKDVSTCRSRWAAYPQKKKKKRRQ